MDKITDFLKPAIDFFKPMADQLSNSGIAISLIVLLLLLAVIYSFARKDQETGIALITALLGVVLATIGFVIFIIQPT